MDIKIKKFDGMVLPESAYDSDTGYDVIAMSDPIIIGVRAAEGVDCWKRVDYIEYDTGICIAPEDGLVKTIDNGHIKVWTQKHNSIGYTLLFPRSSLSKYNLQMCGSLGLIDNSYRNSIKARFRYIWQPEDFIYFNQSDGVVSYGRINLDKIYKKGDRLAQLVAMWKEDIQWKIVDSLDETPRNTDGFGSSGN